MKRKVWDILHHADDRTVTEITELYDAADQQTQDRIYEKTCQLLSQKAGGMDDNVESFSVTMARRPSWIRSIAATAACLVVAGGLTGGAVMLHRSADSTPSPEFAKQTTQVQTQAATSDSELKIQKERTKREIEETTTKPLETLCIVKIVDRTVEEELSFDEALEMIFEDEKNQYFLSGIYSHYVIVYYSDGSQEDVKSALQSGRAKIADLDRFGIWYWTELKETGSTTTETQVPADVATESPCSDPLQTTTTTVQTTASTGETTWPVCSHPLQSTTTTSPPGKTTIVKIVDHASEEGIPVASALEKIYEDDRNEYFFGSICSQYVIVHYSDGTQEDIKSALQSGRAEIADLDRFGISYYTEKKSVDTQVSFGKGIELYIWQMSADSYFCGILPGTNRLKTEDEIHALMKKGVTMEEMREIIASYGVGREEVFICPVQNPESDYIVEINQEYQRQLEALFWAD